MSNYVTGNPTWPKSYPNTLEVLKSARELIVTEDTWVQEMVAMNIDCHECDPIDDDAVAWCAIGAVVRAVQDLGGNPEAMLDETTAGLAALERALVTGPLAHPRTMSDFNDEHPVADFNDEHTHDEVLEMFDRAIEMEESRD